MSEEATPAPAPARVTLDLNALIPEKTAVPTSLGTLYVRSPDIASIPGFPDIDDDELGRRLVAQSTSRILDKQDASSLSEEDAQALGDHDLSALTRAIATHSRWGFPDATSPLSSLGRAARTAYEGQVKRVRDEMERLRKTLDQQYGFVDAVKRSRLQDQMTGLAALRESGSRLRTEDLLTARSSSDSVLKHIRDSERMTVPIPLSAEHIRSFVPAPFEQTPLGQATLETTENSRRTADRTAALAELVGGLNQTLVADVLPAWFKQVEEGQRQAQENTRQSANSLLWTKRGVFLSLLLTVLATVWQVRVAREIDEESSRQQNRAEELLRQQLAAQTQLLERQETEAKLLRALIADAGEALQEARASTERQKGSLRGSAANGR